MNSWIYVHDLDPVLLHLGPLRVGWYGLMYATTFLTAYWYLTSAAKRPDSPVHPDEVPNMVTYLIVGVILGGRLGWVIFYGGLPYLMEPWRIFETWKGGMSFHGGFLGYVAALWVYARRHDNSLVALGDFVLPWVAVGLFLGRMGNFINGELYGAPTDGTWGVIFPSDPLAVPRHPSQIYEALLEGPLLFSIMMAMRGRGFRRGYQASVFIGLYGVIRFGIEFVRLPDRNLAYMKEAFPYMSMGQWLSLPMVFVGLYWAYLVFIKADAKSDPR